MKGTTRDAPAEWFEFTDPNDEDQLWRVHVNFLMSNWKCIFGAGCPGCFGKHEENTVPDMGCCGKGAYLYNRQEIARLQERVELMTEEDLGPKGYAWIRSNLNNWFFAHHKQPDPDDPNTINAKTRVRDGGCVFAKRADDGNELTGCAFVHLGNRLGAADHIDTMPRVCWQLPLGIFYSEDERTEKAVTQIVPWDADHWGGMDEDETHDSWLSWWCVDTPDAYCASTPLYVTMRRELIHMMGQPSYDVLAKYLDSKKTDQVLPMPGTLVNGGKTVLPLYIGNRTPKRSPKT